MEEEIVVIGAGIGRTGTMSLKVALELLLEGKCYHMMEVLKRPSDVSRWTKAAKTGLTHEEWKSLFVGYRAVVGGPGSSFYKDILKVYPKAKVILSVRESKNWITSAKATILSHDLWHTFPMSVIYRFTPLRNFGPMVDCVLNSMLGDNFDVNDEAAAARAFEAWNDSVKSTIPSDQLLVFEAVEGWEPLCKFLGLPVPNVPYPHVNSTREFQQMVNTRNRICWLILVGASAAVGATAFGIYRLVNK